MTSDLSKEDWIILRLVVIGSELARQLNDRPIPLDILAALSHLMDKQGFETVRDATRQLIAERNDVDESISC